MGGSSGDEAFSTKLDAYGNIYTIGFFIGTVDFDPGPGFFPLVAPSSASTLFVQKLNCAGELIWAKAIGGTVFGTTTHGYSLAIDQNQDVCFTGLFRDSTDFDPGIGTYYLTSKGNADIFVAKLDSGGNFLWAKSMGSSLNDWGLSVAIDGNGNVYTTGEFRDTVDFDPGPGTFNLISDGNTDAFIQKLDSSGIFKWAISIGGNSIDVGKSIATDESGYVYTVGQFFGTVDFNPSLDTSYLTSTIGGYGFIQKLDSNGNFVWAVANGGVGNCLALDDNANLHITGYFNNTQDFDPGLDSSFLSSMGSKDIYVQKLDSSSNFFWAVSFGSSSIYAEEGNSITVDSLGNVYSIGQFQDTVDFDPGIGVTNLTSEGWMDIYVQKLSDSGSFIWTIAFGQSFYDYGESISVDDAGSVYATGYFHNTIDFDPGPGINNVSSNGNQDIFIQKLDQGSISCCTSPMSSFTFTDSLLTVSLVNNSSNSNYWQWDFGDSGTSTLQDVTHTYSDTGTYLVCLMAQDLCDSDTFCLSITLNCSSPAFYINDPVINICNGDSALIYGSYQTGAGTYYDSLTSVLGCDSIHSTVLTINQIYNITDSALAVCSGDGIMIYGIFQTNAGIHYDSLTSILGCDSVRSTVLTINQIYIISDSALTVCNGDSVLIYGTYKMNPGTYYDSLTTVKSCDSVHSTILSVGSSPAVSITGLDTLYCSIEAAVSLTGIPTGGIFTGTAGVANNYFYPTTGVNTYVVTYFYEDSLGCSNSDSQSVSVVFCLGISEGGGLPQAKIFPNPNKGEFTVEINSIQTETFELIIFNYLGQPIFTERIMLFKRSYQRNFNLKDYPAGCYLFQLVGDSGIISTQIVIE